jgi:hypothetical protein
LTPSFAKPQQRRAPQRARANGKKLLIYYLQPTWEIAFQHMKIEELVE